MRRVLDEAGAEMADAVSRSTGRALSLLMGVLGLGVLGGFLASLLRRRRGSSYATSLRQPVPSDDRTDGH